LEGKLLLVTDLKTSLLSKNNFWLILRTQAIVGSQDQAKAFWTIKRTTLQISTQFSQEAGQDSQVFPIIFRKSQTTSKAKEVLLAQSSEFSGLSEQARIQGNKSCTC